MKLVFVSNYFNHHQRPFCDEMYKKLGDGFYFISTSEMRAERRKLGYASAADVPAYVWPAYLDEQAYRRAEEMINEADVVIAGATPEKLITERLRMGKLVLRYSERPFKKEPTFLHRLYHGICFRRRDRGSRNVYMLCASAYAAADFSSIGMYKNRMYKWGYFPALKEYDADKLLAEKKKNTILWCGRYIDWKHPDDVIRLASKLKESGCEFQLNMIGTGDMEQELKAMAVDCGVTDVVHFLGAMSPEQVRVHMEEAGIYLFTSDRLEGWGAVLNEAMNSCCAVVASLEAGSTPFLIRDSENGSIYLSGDLDGLYEKVKYYIENPNKQTSVGRAAYRTITDVWNAHVGASCLVELIELLLLEGNKVDIFEEGPCSMA